MADQFTGAPVMQPEPVPERIIAGFLALIQLDCLAIDRARKQIDEEWSKGSDFDGHLIWDWLNQILSRAAGLSKVFWPPDKKTGAYKRRARELYGMFEMTEESPLNDREVRNAIEHIDEHMHEWMKPDRPEGRIIDLAVGGQDFVKEAAGEGDFIFRRFDHENYAIYVGDRHKLAIRPLCDEADRLYKLLPAFTPAPTAGSDWIFVPSESN